MKLYKRNRFYCTHFLLASTILVAATAESADTVVLDEYHINARAAAGGAGSVSQGRLSLSKPVDVAEVLSREMPSVAFVRKGPAAGDFLLRGFGRDNVKVAIDGCEMHTTCPNRMDPPAFHISAQQIERITIRSGPFNVEYGGSVGGAVRIETRAPGEDPELGAMGYAGSFGYFSASASGSGRAGSVSGAGGVSWQKGGVYRDGDGVRFTELPGTNFRPEFRDTTAFSILQLQGKASARVGESDELSVAGGFNRSTDVLYPGLRMDTLLDESWRASTAWSHAVGSPLVQRLRVEAHFSGVYHDMRDTYRTTSLNPMFADRGFMMRTLAWSSNAHLRAVTEGAWSGGAIRMGADYSERRWDADNLVMAKRNPILPDVLSRRIGGFVSNVWERNEISLETGLRIDSATSRARGDLAFTQGAHGTETNRNSDLLTSAYVLGQRQFSSWRAYAGLGHGQRMPDPQERYINLDRPMMNPDWVGNPDLKPVKSTEIQAGIAGGVADWTVHAGVFHSWLGNYIYLARLTPAPGSTANPMNTRSYTNLDARLYGAELAATWDIDASWSAEFGAAFLRGTRDRSLPGNTSDVLGEVPETQWRAAVNWSPAPWTVRLAIRGALEQSRVDPDLGEKPLDAWQSVDLLVSRDFGDAWTATLGVENLLDATYRLHNAYLRDPFASGVVVNEPGRFIYLRARWAY